MATKTMMMKVALVVLIASLVTAVAFEDSFSCHEDVSWAIYGTKLSNHLGSERQFAYDDFMRQCRKHVSARSQKDWCGLEDAHRRSMNLQQPSSVWNYTETGFLKTRIPDSLFATLLTFWHNNLNTSLPTEKTADAYHNSWEAAPKMMNILESRWDQGGVELYSQVASSVQTAMQKWTGVPQAFASAYGVRVYPRNAVLAPHLDRLPLVSSAILHLAQDTEEDWPLEIYDHEGRSHNVTLSPGEMLLYESHSSISGRPFPLKGNYYANVYVHFEPLLPPPSVQVKSSSSSSNHQDYNLPPYLIPNSPWARKWESSHPQGWQVDAHKLAQQGDKRSLQYLAGRDPSILHQTDGQGWQPLHEAVRFGHLELVQYLILDAGISWHNMAVSPLAIAEEHLPPGHDVIDFLRDPFPNHHPQVRGENRTVTRVRWV